MVSVLGPLFRTAGHVVRTQHGVTASAGQRRGDVEIRNYLRDQAGSLNQDFQEQKCSSAALVPLEIPSKPWPCTFLMLPTLRRCEK
jgi:hypothetical protein